MIYAVIFLPIFYITQSGENYIMSIKGKSMVTPIVRVSKSLVDQGIWVTTIPVRGTPASLKTGQSSGYKVIFGLHERKTRTPT